MNYKISVLRHLGTNERYVVMLRRLGDGVEAGGLCTGICTKEQVGGWILVALHRYIEWPAEIEIDTDLVEIEELVREVQES